MLKTVFGTISTRLITAVLSFVIVIFNSRFLGATGQGTISLFVLGITLNSLISSFIGGPALVYLIPRYSLFKLSLLSYIWALISSFIGTLLLAILHLIPRELVFDIFIVSLIFQFASVNTSVLLGKKKIFWYNLASISQLISIFCVLSFFLFFLNKIEVSSYITALKLGNFIFFALSFAFFAKQINEIEFSGMYSILLQMFKFGAFVQFANILQLMNYRLSYYIIEFYLGRNALGQYSVGVQFSESLWLISRSLSMIQYSEISNSTDFDFNKKITIQFVKFSFAFTVLGLFFLIIIPKDFFIFLLNKDFENIKTIIFSLVFGILSMSVSVIFSHYLSGIGKHFYNTIGSGIGFFVTLILGFLLIPKFGILGAGITTSTSYFISAIYLFIIFVKKTNVKIVDFVIRKSDFNYIIHKIKLIIKKE